MDKENMVCIPDGMLLLEKKEVLSLVTMWITWEDIKLDKIIQCRKANAAWFWLDVGYKKVQLIGQLPEAVGRVEGSGEWLIKR